MARRNQHALLLQVEVQDYKVHARDVVFFVYRKGKKFGELRVSQGAVVWYGRKDKDGRKLGWTKFADLLESDARREERRAPGTRKSAPRAARRA